LLTVTKILNPFSSSKQVYQKELNGQGVYELAGIENPEDWLVTVNGKVVVGDFIPAEGDFVLCRPVISGGSDTNKKVVGVLAAVALTIVTMGVGSVFAGGAFMGAGFIGMAGWGAASYLAAGLMAAGGNYLINRYMLAEQPLTENNISSSANGWSPLSTLTGQGNPLPITYGTRRTAGQLVYQRVYTSGTQKLNMVICGGEGPCDYTGNGEDSNCTGIASIKINDTDIDEFAGITIYKRAGLNDQSFLEISDGFWQSQYPNVQLDNPNNDVDPVGVWVNKTTTGNAVSDLEVVLNFPAGAWTCYGAGKFSISMKFDGEYSVKDANDWHKLTWDGSIDTCYPWMARPATPPQYPVYSDSEGRWYTLGATESAFTLKAHVEDLALDAYDVRVMCREVYENHFWFPDPNFTNRSTCYYQEFNARMGEVLVRQNKILLGMSALATEDLNGSVPNVTWEQTRSKVWVWNPDDDEYQEKDASNPAWCAYDLICRIKHLYNINTSAWVYETEGISTDNVDFQSFSDWSTFCDEEVEVLVEGEEVIIKRCVINWICDVYGNLWDALKTPESTGRGKVVIKGTKFSCIWDGTADPVQLFTSANIIAGSFSETFLSDESRSNAVEVTFYSEDKNYERDIFFLTTEDYDASDTRTATVNLDGITDFNHAYREALYRLRLNKYLLRTISFSADVDAIACQVGDVILVQHDVPKWAIGGRIAYSTVDGIQLDNTVVLQPDVDYEITIRNQITDTLATHEVIGVGVETVTAFIQIVDPPEIMLEPQTDYLYSFGEVDKSAKPFRVVSITRDGDFRRKLSCLEYIEEVYIDDATVPEINYSQDMEFRSGLILTKSEDVDGHYLLADWIEVGLVNLVKVYFDGVFLGHYDHPAKIYLTAAGYHTVKTVYLISGKKVGSDEETIWVDNIAPPAPTDFQVVQNFNNFVASWTNPTVNYITKYEIRLGSTWDNGSQVGVITDPTDHFEWPIFEVGTYHFWIKSISVDKVCSLTADDCEIIVTELDIRNIIRSWDEIIEPTGTCVNTYVSAGNAHMDTLGGRLSDYTRDAWITMQSAIKLTEGAFAGTYTTEAYDLSVVTTCGLLIDSEIFCPANTGYTISYRTANVPGGWGSWITYIAQSITTRYLQVKLALTSANGIDTPIVTGFEIILDVPDLAQQGIANITLGLNGNRVIYPISFRFPPGQYDNGYLEVTPIGVGLRAEVGLESYDYFYCNLYNEDDDLVAGTIYWQAKGF